MSMWILLVCLMTVQLCCVHGFASWFSCYNDLIEGEYIMGHPSVLDNERGIEVYRGDQQLRSGDAYIAGETIEVKLSSNAGQYVLEAYPFPDVKFINGTCKGQRFVKEGGPRSPMRQSYLSIPEEMKGDIRLWAGWAEGYDVVKITQLFFLKPGAPGEAAAINPSDKEGLR